MRNIDIHKFPQKRNGVSHPLYGVGVVTAGRYAVSDGDGDGDGDGDSVMVKFDSYTDPKIVKCDDLESVPSRGVSPDPATSRNSGWVGGNSYRKRKR